jgi:predicted CoA-substrate-specific enzyme activase
VPFYLGIDVGSVTAKFVLLEEDGGLADSVYLRTHGKPIAGIQEGLSLIQKKAGNDTSIIGVGTTGSARHLAGAIVGADMVKNEITCQSVGTLRFIPEVRTILEMGGQDSKIIILRQGMIADFGMNTVCAAGTGSFLDHQASRLNISIEAFGESAVTCQRPVRISGQCTVFAESDMLQKQQMGHAMEDILYGLCQALARNYLHDIGSGKEILPPIVFQGGVAFNAGMVRAIEELLKEKITVPPHHEVMGAIGAGLIVMSEGVRRNKTSFNGFRVISDEYGIELTECKACPSLCEIAQVLYEGKRIASWGGRCDLWETASTAGIAAA